MPKSRLAYRHASLPMLQAGARNFAKLCTRSHCCSDLDDGDEVRHPPSHLSCSLISPTGVAWAALAELPSNLFLTQTAQQTVQVQSYYSSLKIMIGVFVIFRFFFSPNCKMVTLEIFDRFDLKIKNFLYDIRVLQIFAL